MKSSHPLLAFLLMLLAASSTGLADPAWWSAPGTSIFYPNTPQTTQNWAPLNAGQLKNVAIQARNYLNLRLKQGMGAGDSIETMCAQFVDAENYSPVNVGQLKNIARLYYDRLNEIGYIEWLNAQQGSGDPIHRYPWEYYIVEDDYAPANIGQLKNLFSFEITTAFLSIDANNDGILDWIARDLANYDPDDQYNLPSDIKPEDDFDGDGLTNSVESGLGTSPFSIDTDLDGHSDGAEPSTALNPNAHPSDAPDTVANEDGLVGEARRGLSHSLQYDSMYAGAKLKTLLQCLGVLGPPAVDAGDYAMWIDAPFATILPNPYEVIWYSQLGFRLRTGRSFQNVWSGMALLVGEDVPPWYDHPPNVMRNDHWAFASKWPGVEPGVIAGFANETEHTRIRLHRQNPSSQRAVFPTFWLDLRWHCNHDGSASLPGPPSGGESEFLSAGFAAFQSSHLADYYVNEVDIDNALLVKRNFIIPAGQRVSSSKLVDPFPLVEEEGKMNQSGQFRIAPMLRSRNVRFQHIAGPAYRRVAASGRPAESAKPTFQTETDVPAEHIYVDALTRSLDHYTSDVYVPLGSSELALQVTRRIQPRQWQNRPPKSWEETAPKAEHGMHEPFGPGWSTNLTAYAHIDVKTEENGTPAKPLKVTVVDADGQSIQFFGIETSENVYEFAAVPHGLPGEQAFEHTLRMEEDGTDKFLILRKRHGTESKYHALPNVLKNESAFRQLADALNPPPAEPNPYRSASQMMGFGRDLEVYRLVEITNSRKDRIRYIYGDPSGMPTDELPNPLVPHTIEDGRLPSQDATKIRITQMSLGDLSKAGLVHKIVDPLGNDNTIHTLYEYGGGTLTHQETGGVVNPGEDFDAGSRWLSGIKHKVHNPVTGGQPAEEHSARYQYSLLRQFDEPAGVIIRHLCLQVIEAGENRKHRFYYENDLTKVSRTVPIPRADIQTLGLPAFLGIPGNYLYDKTFRLMGNNLEREFLQPQDNPDTMGPRVRVLTGEPPLVKHIVLPGGPQVVPNMDWNQKGITSFFTIPVNNDIAGYKLIKKAAYPPDDPFPYNFSFGLTTRVRDAEGNLTDYAFGDAAVQAGQGAFLGSKASFPSDWHHTVLVVMTHMRIDHRTPNGTLMGSEHFEFSPQASLALAKAVDFSGNQTLFEYADLVAHNGTPLSNAIKDFYALRVLGGSSFTIDRFSQPTKEIKVDPIGPNPNHRIKWMAYHPKTRAVESIIDEATGTETKYEFLSIGQEPPTSMRKAETVYRIKEDQGREQIKRTESSYLWEINNDAVFPAFVTSTRTWAGAGHGSHTDAEYIAVTERAINPAGRVATETVMDGETEYSTTGYTYDANGNVIRIEHPRHHAPADAEANDGPTYGHITEFRYDTRNRLVETKRPGYTRYDSVEEIAEIKWFTYDRSSRKIKETRLDAMGTGQSPCTFYDYDGAGHLMRVTQDLGTLGVKSGRSIDVVNEYVSDWTGRRTAAIDPRGVTTTYAYDALGRLTTETTGLLSADHQVATAAPQPVYTTNYHYTNSAGQSVNCGGSVFASSTFKPLRVTTMRSVGLEETHYQYDCFYRETSRTLKHHNGITSLKVDCTVTTIYKDFSTGALPENAPAGATSFITVLDPIKGESRTWFDAAGRAICVDSAVEPGFTKRHRTLNYYTGFDAVWKTEVVGEEESTRTSYVKFDRLARPYLTRSPKALHYENNFATTPAWAALDVEIEVRTWYDVAGNVVKVGDPRTSNPNNPPVYTEYKYDGRNRLWQTISVAELDSESQQAQKSIVTNTYDVSGNLIKVIDPRGKATDTLYDAMNRPYNVKLPPITISAVSATPPPATGGLTPNHRPTTVTTYDKAGNVLSLTDPNGRTTNNVYDSMGRLWRTTDASGIQTAFMYDSANNRISVIDGLNKTTTFTYDGLARLTRTLYPGKPGITITYNDSAGTSSRTSGRGYVMVTTLDYRKRVQSITHPTQAGENLTYIYDEFGNLASVQRNISGHEYSIFGVDYLYDALNRLVQERSANAVHMYSYDRAGNRTQLTTNTQTDGSYSNGRKWRTAYDKLSRPSAIQEIAGDVVQRTTSYKYDKASRRTGIVYANGLYEVFDHDDANRLIKQTLYPSTDLGTPRRTFLYRHDAKGNLRVQTETIGSAIRHTLNGYDTSDRQLHETIEFVSGTTTKDHTHYAYDNSNNRTHEWRYQGTIWASHQPATATATYSYGAFNELLSRAGPGYPSATFTYDHDGNRATRTSGGVLTTYSYDRFDRLLSVSSPGAIHYYNYDYRSRRIWRRDAGQTSAQISVISFAGGTSVLEFARGTGAFNPSGLQPTVMYARGSDQGGGVGGLLYSLRPDGGNWIRKFNTFNARGDVVGQTKDDKTVTFETAYQADGRTAPGITNPGSSPDRQRANTKEEDPTGLLNEGFRYRDLETGVFLTRDPAGFIDGPNLYSYVKQNPWTAFDPEGLSPQSKAVKALFSPEDLAAREARDMVNGRHVRIAWNAVPGNTLYFNGKLGKKYKEGVFINQKGYPDFSPYAEFKGTKIEGMKGDSSDFVKADKQAGFNKSNPRPEGWTWHHHENGTMELVPTDLHNAVPHTGSASVARSAKDVVKDGATAAASFVAPNTMEAVSAGGGLKQTGIGLLKDAGDMVDPGFGVLADNKDAIGRAGWTGDSPIEARHLDPSAEVKSFWSNLWKGIKNPSKFISPE